MSTTRRRRSTRRRRCGARAGGRSIGADEDAVVARRARRPRRREARDNARIASCARARRAGVRSRGARGRVRGERLQRVVVGWTAAVRERHNDDDDDDDDGARYDAARARGRACGRACGSARARRRCTGGRACVWIGLHARAPRARTLVPNGRSMKRVGALHSRAEEHGAHDEHATHEEYELREPSNDGSRGAL